jgi:hypothetical protein
MSWGNPECQQQVTEVCPDVGGRTTEQREYNTQGIVGGASLGTKYDRCYRGEVTPSTTRKGPSGTRSQSCSLLAKLSSTIY